MKISFAAVGSCRFALAAVLAGIALQALAEPVSLAPVFAGQYAAGSGVDATFLKVYDTWQKSSALWNEAAQQYGNGVPVSSYAWGDGLWGISDWQTANYKPSPGMIEASWNGRVSEIAFGDALYNSLYGTKPPPLDAKFWGAVPLAPLFSPDGKASQNNWTSLFSGYIRISEAGVYNFGVLYDDGFFFNLGGADGKSLALADDYLNPRNRLGFANNLQLDAGLYSFELGAYDRIQAGVVELSWARDDGAWSRVPTEHLVAAGDVAMVPEPGSLTLVLAALLALGSLAAHRRASRR